MILILQKNKISNFSFPVLFMAENTSTSNLFHEDAKLL